jgi:protein O-mannosyl-transferase
MSRKSKVKADHRPAEKRSWQGRAWLPGLLLMLSGIAVYSNTFDVPFIFDDRIRIEENPALHQLWPLSIPMRNSNRPFGMVTFAVNYALHGQRVWGYHVTNLAIHILGGLALFGIVRRTLSLGGLAVRYGAIATPLAFAIALLWLVHPLNTQAVTYVVQRLESLMGLCYLATLYCFIRGQASLRRAWWYVASVACCALGMGVKEVMVTAPVMVLWYHRAFVARGWQVMFRGPERFYYLALCSTWSILAWAMLRSRTEYEAGNIGTVKGVTPVDYLLSQAGVITYYLRLSVWPYGQCLDYGWPVARTAGEIVVPLLFVATLIVATALAIFRHPAWGFLGGWFFVILGPTSSVVPILDLAFEQRMYLPLAAVVAAFVFGVREGLNYLAKQHVLSRQRVRWAGFGLMWLVVLTMSTLTWRRNELYRNEIDIWTDALKKAPDNARVHDTLGLLYRKRGKHNEALAHAQRSVELAPANSDVHANLGAVLLDLGQIDAAVAQQQKALELNSRSDRAHVNLGVALQKQQRYEESLFHFREAVALNPTDLETQTNLANALAERGNKEEALLHFLQALAIQPENSSLLSDTAMTLQGLGRLRESAAYFSEALRISPNFALAHNNFGITLMGLGQFAEAVAHFKKAIELDPQLAVAHANLGHALADRGRNAEAIRHLQRALEIQPELTNAKVRLESLRKNVTH